MKTLARLIPILGMVIPILGCSALKPDYLTAGYAHQSQPFAGPGSAPWGDHNHTDETTYDDLEAGARWEKGAFYFEASVGYAVWYHNVGAGPWSTTFRVGTRIRLP